MTPTRRRSEAALKLALKKSNDEAKKLGNAIATNEAKQHKLAKQKAIIERQLSKLHDELANLVTAPRVANDKYSVLIKTYLKTPEAYGFQNALEIMTLLEQ
jgi:vacuolar-type H+-ATPase subunit E/Vma4